MIRATIVAVAGSAIALAALVPGPAAAQARSPALSDKVTFAGIATPSRDGTFRFASNRCSLTSSDETQPTSCRMTSTMYISASGHGIGSAKATSSDGLTHWSFTLKPASTGSCTMNGSGTEAAGGIPGAVSVHGSITVIPAAAGRSSIGCAPVRFNLFVQGTAAMTDSQQVP